MADLSVDFCGIRAPNPFWLASAPPTDKEYNIERAFRAGWGGVVWKTLGEDGPPIVNVSGPRYGAIHGPDRRVIGFNNIELITDRPLDVNLREIKAVKRRWPDRAMVVSLMVPCDEDSWKRILARVEETEADGVELNFGCPHGMSERGMGSAVGQVPEYVEMVARWCKAHTRMPVIVKLTPNISDIRKPAEAAKNGGADAVSLINTVNSIMGVDLDRMVPAPHTDGKATHGGMCGPAVKPMALNMVAEISRHPETHGLPISGIGGIETWRDAAEFMALGCGTVQVCTAAMVYGFRIVSEMIAGLEAFMDERGFSRLDDFVGAAVPNVTDWQYLNLNYAVKARIDQELCIKCGRCDYAREERRAPLRGRRRGVRRLQSVRGGLPGGELHHPAPPHERGRPAHGAVRGRLLPELDAAPEQSDGEGAGGVVGGGGGVALRLLSGGRGGCLLTPNPRSTDRAAARCAPPAAGRASSR
jgi:dihydropyrimidine dehydrogenase (NAD+) subunit PreA